MTRSAAMWACKIVASKIGAFKNRYPEYEPDVIIYSILYRAVLESFIDEASSNALVPTNHQDGTL